MTSLPWFQAVLVGAGMGFCSGLFGLGGSSIGTPILRLFGLPALIALASPLPLTLPSAILHRRGCANGGAIAYQKDRLIHWRIAVLTSLWGCPGVLIGAWLTAFIPATTLMLLTALFILGVGAYGLSEFRSRAFGSDKEGVHAIDIRAKSLDAAEPIHVRASLPSGNRGNLVIVEPTSPPVGVALQAHPEFRHQFRY